ncbi:hypothetical protein ACFOWE_06210 [Planomonospora corallina]|uniref:Uncharacterized protein n=1 Tax=Planomonospora corallina TaxID=1806052 RepID=A0ABV8I489_9ACTN
MRNLAVGRTVYSGGGILADALPKGKKWMKATVKGGVPSPFMTPLYALEPATLRTLLTTASGKSSGAGTTVYKGTITAAALHRVSPSYRASLDGGGLTAKQGSMKVRWTLWIGRDRLPGRLVSAWQESGALGVVKKTSDVRLSGWGRRVVLTPPPAGQVAS